jgi:hypothetical protein
MAKIGISSLFSFRPHVEHLAYLAEVLTEGGHEISGFDCVASVKSCYPKNLRGKSALWECTKCLTGGIRSFGVPVELVINRKYKRTLPKEQLKQMSVSSVATALRTESANDLETDEFKEMQSNVMSSIEVAYGSALAWIDRSKLDGIILFNGRMDLTAGVIAACRDANVPFITTERAWFGHGVHMIPNGNCLDISPISRLCAEFINKPLGAAQIALAAKIAAERYLRENKFEWRLYNENEIKAVWPGTSQGPRILVVPSSRNEFEGHPERMCNWTDYTDAMQLVIERLGGISENVVLRCHPNWAENIGKRTGFKSEEHYSKWAKKHGYQIVGSKDTRSTYDLIEQADIILVNGSSAGVEAGIRGKAIVSVGRCSYEAAGFSTQIHHEGELDKLDDLDNLKGSDVILHTLRYIYIHARRFPQFVDYIRAISTSKCNYYEGANPNRIIDIFRTRRLEADDKLFANYGTEEEEILDLVERGKWGILSKYKEQRNSGPEFSVNRRLGLNWVGHIREKLPRGDR